MLDASAFNDIMAKSFPDLSIASGSTESGAPAYIVKYKPMQVSQIESNAMDQALETIRNRIDQLGVRETTVVKEGDNEILVQLPGIQDPQEAKNRSARRPCSSSSSKTIRIAWPMR